MAQYNQDWEDMGKTIQEIIDRAVNSQDYQKMNRTISQIVNKAVDTGTEAIHKAKTQSVRRSSTTWQYQPPIRSSDRSPSRQNLPMLYENVNGKTAGGILKIIGGSLLAGGTLLGLIATTVLQVLVWGTNLLTVPFLLCGAGLVGGTVLLGNGIGNLSKLSRFKTYIKVLGQKTHCELGILARNVGKNAKFVKKDLEKMIDEGLFLEGHLDAENKSLITSNETYAHYEQSRKLLEERKRQELAQKKMQQQSQPVSPQVQEVLDRGHAYILEIRKCNDEIPGEEISDKISRMETIVRRIFERAETHPEIVPDLKKLMNYYLPMTVKLLNAYAEMDRQSIQGETIAASKREIENTLDTLNSAFEKLLDSIFRETAMDVSSDISVLQTLLAQEGLTDDGFDELRRENKQ